MGVGFVHGIFLLEALWIWPAIVNWFSRYLVLPLKHFDAAAQGFSPLANPRTFLLEPQCQGEDHLIVQGGTKETKKLLYTPISCQWMREVSFDPAV